jgi:hypothetical protein
MDGYGLPTADNGLLTSDYGLLTIHVVPPVLALPFVLIVLVEWRRCHLLLPRHIQPTLLFPFD